MNVCIGLLPVAMAILMWSSTGLLYKAGIHSEEGGIYVFGESGVKHINVDDGRYPGFAGGQVFEHILGGVNAFDTGLPRLDDITMVVLTIE